MQPSADILPFTGALRARKNSAAAVWLAALIVVCRTAVYVLAGAGLCRLVGI